MNLYQKLVAVRKSIPYLQKDKKAYNYMYVSGTQVLSEVRKKIDELSLLLVPNVTKSSYQDVDDKGKPERLVLLEMSFCWINAENPEERLNIPWQAMGQNAREKGLGCALTYAERYFLLKFFSVPTDDMDPDAYHDEYQLDEKKTQDDLHRAALSDDIKAELSRTRLNKDSIVLYCQTNNIPTSAKDCTIDQLMAIKTHLMSQPSK